MKVFIAQPMIRKTDEQVREEIVLAVERIKCQFPNEEIEFLDNVMDQDENQLWLLGKSIEFLADADLAYFIRGWKKYRRYKLENKIAKKYGINVIEEKEGKNGITAKFIKGRTKAIIILNFCAENRDEATNAANTIAANIDQYPEFISTRTPKICFDGNIGRVVFNGLVDNSQESKDAIIRLTHHAEGLYENTNAECVHVEVCIGGKWYGRD